MNKKQKSFKISKLQFKDPDKHTSMIKGADIDQDMREDLRDAFGIAKKLVEANRNTIISGPPGVGKSYGALDELKKAGKKFIQILPGMSPIQIVCKLAYAVYSLKPGEEVVVLMDDADDVVFSEYGELNKWKLAMAPVDYALGSIPHYHYTKSIMATIQSLEKQKRNDLAEALRSFMKPDELGISIPTDRVRFVILCNLDLEDPKAFSSKKMWNAIEPVVDRNNYIRKEYNAEDQWGWLAHVLGTTQPFPAQINTAGQQEPAYPLTNAQKIELLNWMKPRWEQLRTSSYRTVRKLAEHMINYPDRYEGKWKTQLKTKKD
jgi:hypothetical protein